ncbi:MAG: DUF4129 domain-containing protein [Chloroflexi bacterium]|nr:DUF4129 domain-containing protein [Chloroflexota bacterium]
MPAQPIVSPAEARPARRISWRQEYLHLAVIMMTACWLAPWVALSLSWFMSIDLAAALGLTAMNLLASMLLVRWLQYRRVESRVELAMVLLMMWLAAAIVLVLMPSLARVHGSEERLALRDLFYFDPQQRVPAGPIVIVWVLVLWWRGYRLGSAYMTLVRASFGMRLGILSFFIVILAAGGDLRADVLSLLPFFFFFGLLASSLARADSLNLDRAGRDSPFGRGWIASLFVITLALTASGYVAALWLAGLDTTQAAEALATIGGGLLTLIFLLLSPLLLLAQAIYDLIPRGSGTPVQFETGQREPPDQISTPWLADVFTVLGDALVVIVLLLVAIMVLALIWFLFIARGDRQEQNHEERESIGTGEVVGGLRTALRDSLRRLMGALGLFQQFGLGRDLFAALTIRRIYARMEKLAGKRGYPRTLSETPYEYRRELHLAFPGMDSDVQTITEAYVAVRYGDVPESRAELDQVRAAWDRLDSSPDPEQVSNSHHP